MREVAEETGLRVRVLRLAGRVEIAAASTGSVYEVADFVCTLAGGQLQASDDALEARWVTRPELAALPLVPDLFEALAGWDCLPR